MNSATASPSPLAPDPSGQPGPSGETRQPTPATSTTANTLPVADHPAAEAGNRARSTDVQSSSAGDASGVISQAASPKHAVLPSHPFSSRPAPAQAGRIGDPHRGERVEKTFTPLVRQFLDYLRLEKHFSDYTVKSYGADLIQFGQFLGGEIGQPVAAAGATKLSPDEVDKKKLACEPLTIREFLAYLYGQNYTKSTTARKLATLRSFYKFLIRRGLVAVNPLEHHPHAQAGQAPPQVPGPGAGAEAARGPRRRGHPGRAGSGDA